MIWLETEELVEFFAELFKLLTRISEGKKDAETLSIFLSEWRETALINSEPEVLADIVEAQKELAELSHITCYDISGVGRMYQSRLQCPQSDARTVVDNPRGYSALFRSIQSAGK